MTKDIQLKNVSLKPFCCHKDEIDNFLDNNYSDLYKLNIAHIQQDLFIPTEEDFSNFSNKFLIADYKYKFNNKVYLYPHFKELFFKSFVVVFVTIRYSDEPYVRY